MLSQTVLLRGVNDTPEALESLLRTLVSHRIKPYYLHHPDLCRRGPVTCGYRWPKDGPSSPAYADGCRGCVSRSASSTSREASARCQPVKPSSKDRSPMAAFASPIPAAPCTAIASRPPPVRARRSEAATPARGRTMRPSPTHYGGTSWRCSLPASSLNCVSLL